MERHGGKEKNLRWKTAVPLPGNNSPVVWKDRVFLSGADENRREVYCFDAESGKLLWQKAVPATPQSSAKPERPPDAGYAAPTVATDGRRVFAIFANGDLAGFDMNGNLAWSKSLGIPESTYGYASSLTMYKNLLIVQFDQGDEKESEIETFCVRFRHGRNRLAGRSQSAELLGLADRDPRRRPRSNRHRGQSLGDRLRSPRTARKYGGRNACGSDVGPSPTFAAGKVFTANDGTYLSAIPADGQGDVTEKILWKGEDGMPDTCSLLANEQFVLLLDSDGTLTCYDAEKGDKLWEESFDEGGSSSPSFVG